MVDGLSCAAFSRLQGADWAASVSILFAIAFGSVLPSMYYTRRKQPII
jgi:uncharacterized membrane protein YjjP (DUF1212 family)